MYFMELSTFPYCVWAYVSFHKEMRTFSLAFSTSAEHFKHSDPSDLEFIWKHRQQHVFQVSKICSYTKSFKREFEDEILVRNLKFMTKPTSYHALCPVPSHSTLPCSVSCPQFLFRLWICVVLIWLWNFCFCFKEKLIYSNFFFFFNGPNLVIKFIFWFQFYNINW